MTSTRSNQQQQQAMATNTEDNIMDTTIMENKDDGSGSTPPVQITAVVPFNMSSSNTDVNNLDLLDPSIMADRETSMQVTTWVRANYVQEREHNVPRRNMFEHYKAYCTSNDLTPVNSATFGKLLRVVFPELKTRRLGVRGQSKYHYCGIRVRTPDDHDILPIMNHPYIENTPTAMPQLPSPAAAPRRYIRSNASGSTSASSSIPPSPSVAPPPTSLPNFNIPTITSVRLTETDNNMIASFTANYERHCREIFHLISSNQVEKIRGVMTTFYTDMPERYTTLIQNIPEITEAVWRWDCLLYDTMILTFLPSVNHPLLPDMVKSLRTYTRELGEYIDTCLVPYPQTFYQKKADVARIFAAKFRRQLSLNFAAQTASTILNMHDHLEAMRQDWERLDFDGILDQTLWVCECDTNEVRNMLRQEVFELLNTKTAVENWMDWLASLVERYLKRYVPASINDATHYLSRSKQLLLKWTFYASLIMKDLTLQQARSFGSFHSLRLFLDDYILYLVEENIAQVNYSLMQQHQQQEPQQPQQQHSANYFTTSPAPSDRNTK